MASINKLSLRGIRAFSPEDQEQVSPLTTGSPSLRILVVVY